jgi:hypothetical protein
MKLLGFFQATFIYVNQPTVSFNTHSDEINMDERPSHTFFFITLFYAVLSFLSCCSFDVRKNRRISLFFLLLF